MPRFQVMGQLTISRVPWRWQARTMRSPSDRVQAMGFSMQTSAPRLAQASASSACRAFSLVTMHRSGLSASSMETWSS